MTARTKAIPRRVDFTNRNDDFQVLILGSLGLSTKCILKKLPHFSPCQITYRLSAGRVKRADYRDGNNTIAQIIIDETEQKNGDLKDLRTLIRSELDRQNKQPKQIK